MRESQETPTTHLIHAAVDEDVVAHIEAKLRLRILVGRICHRVVRILRYEHLEGHLHGRTALGAHSCCHLLDKQ